MMQQAVHLQLRKVIKYYNKQTGINSVVNTPLESLSVNLPLGSTITCDAYKEYSRIDSADVFIETADDKTICYKDYYWEY